MRIYILGITGMLGSQLFLNFIKNKKFITKGSTRKRHLNIFQKYDNFIDYKMCIDENNFEEFKKKISSFKPDYIINCIGVIKQKIDPKNDLVQTLFINSILPHKLYQISKSINSKLIHFSTDCVFDGKKGNYNENYIPDAEDIYGISKYLGEISENNACTIRTSIIGREYFGKKGLLEWFLSRRKYCDGYQMAFFSGLTTLEIYKFLINYFFRKKFSGLLHLHSSKISKYTLLEKIKKIYKIKITIKKTKIIKTNRSLKSLYLKNFFKYKSPSWNKMLKDMKNEIRVV